VGAVAERLGRGARTKHVEAVVKIQQVSGKEGAP